MLNANGNAYDRFDVSPECSVELSPHGYQFFAELFQTFDKVKRAIT
jgi:hypothetical protein